MFISNIVEFTLFGVIVVVVILCNVNIMLDECLTQTTMNSIYACMHAYSTYGLVVHIWVYWCFMYDIYVYYNLKGAGICVTIYTFW